MKNSGTIVLCLKIFKAKTGIVEHELICVESTSIRCQDGDSLGYGVADPAKLRLIVSQVLLRPGTLDRDAREMGDLIDDVLMLQRGATRVGSVHCERPQHLTFRG